MSRIPPPSSGSNGRNEASPRRTRRGWQRWQGLLSEGWAFFLLVVVSVLAAYCIEWGEALLALILRLSPGRGAGES